MNQVQKKYVILGSLCALVLTLAVGYAAFQTFLKINGTSTISSNWNVEITNIKEGNIVGSASTTIYKEGDKVGQKIMSYEKLTATFSADLQSPGDSIEYIITVTNNGSLDAKLDKITVSDPDNEYVTFETSGLQANDELKSKTSKELTVKATFKDVTISKSEPSTSTLKVTLDFSQKDGSSIGPSEGGDTFTGTVYRWNMENLKIGDSIEGKTTTTDPTTLGKNSYLKHDVVDNKITASYACFITDTEHCIQGGDVSYYDSNKAIIQSQQEWFTNHGGSCEDQGSIFTCSGGGFSLIRVNSASVNANTDTEICFVNNLGQSFCYEGVVE